jgi:hypothetical protein
MARLYTAGFAATAVMTVFMAVLAQVGFPDVDLAQIIGATLFGSAPVGTGPWWAGMAIHIFSGAIAFPLAYLLLCLLLPRASPVLCGWLLGMLLFLGGEGVAIPLTGGGFFSSKADQPTLTVIEDFSSHTVYGILLGLLAAPSVSSARSAVAARAAARGRPS